MLTGLPDWLTFADVAARRISSLACADGHKAHNIASVMSLFIDSDSFP
jgi:hypothetical protein